MIILQATNAVMDHSPSNLRGEIQKMLPLKQNRGSHSQSPDKTSSITHSSKSKVAEDPEQPTEEEIQLAITLDYIGFHIVADPSQTRSLKFTRERAPKSSTMRKAFSKMGGDSTADKSRKSGKAPEKKINFKDFIKLFTMDTKPDDAMELETRTIWLDRVNLLAALGYKDFMDLNWCSYQGFTRHIHHRIMRDNVKGVFSRNVADKIWLVAIDTLYAKWFPTPLLEWAPERRKRYRDTLRMQVCMKECWGFCGIVTD